ncbi:flagellar biosynthesis protein FlgA [Rhodothalassium salexigens]|uniref:flagellar basal body P-ring protein FlgI n=1 Tax=Rhodothalassium salexigens TaxID=1086 RepID=UPI001912FE71|nr:flagellar basal body P-ring protein FlgI [Rhodothalassium salexigens]MBK5919509.1 flagellar biosynthesis protein FlgA [Rhodothalassium salexigens]
MTFHPVLRIATMLVGLFALASVNAEGARTRLKDIIDVEGVRENQLIGYGLVTGLNGTGDFLQNVPFTQQSLTAMLERLGTNIRDTRILIENTAAVMVTADLPPFARPGSRIDVQVSAIGDAEDLRGGVLLATPLKASDGEVYAVAQGPVAVAGFSAQGNAASIVQGVPTSGRIANGAIVEKQVDFEFSQLESLKLALKNPDFTTAKRIEQAIDGYFGQDISQAIDPATVQLFRPVGFEESLMDMVVGIEQLQVTTDQPARIVIDDRAGIIVMGADVRVSTVAIAQGNLTIRIAETPQVSQPDPFGGGETQVVPRTDVEVDAGDQNRLAVVPEAVTLQELVDGLNALGIGPRDMISILQAIKASGALQAEIEIQ